MVDVQIEAAADWCVVVGQFLINEHTGGVVAIEITTGSNFGVSECVASECCGVACELAVNGEGIEANGAGLTSVSGRFCCVEGEASNGVSGSRRRIDCWERVAACIAVDEDGGEGFAIGDGEASGAIGIEQQLWEPVVMRPFYSAKSVERSRPADES